MTRWTKCKELCYLRREGHIVGLAILDGREEKITETVDVIGEEGTVICLSNCRDCGGTNLNAEVRELLKMWRFCSRDVTVVFEKFNSCVPKTQIFMPEYMTPEK